ncbi:4'-phosphopantetheinyl transferase superfamily protein [Streptomyces sp. SAS_267]|uniref:4'-phosphopantetheinyl transferase superfamily protein n=1 Tax=Streptomyces sp. SAS_267 TaxID=3412750 RepID=UPI00403D2C1D
MVSQDGAPHSVTPAPAPVPCHVPGPDGPWEQVQERIELTGRAVVHTTWGQWLTAALLDPELRTLLGRDWPRYRQHPAPAGRLILAVSRTVLKHTAAQVLQVPSGRLDLAYLPGGRPVLRGLGADLQVSLAHTDELIVVGVSRVGPLGVDAEPAGRRISLPALCEHVCTAQEARLLEALPEQERTGAFLRLWTLKEAYAKALGHGMRRRFTAIGFEWDATGRARLAGDTAGQWSFATHLVDGRYLVSEAYRHDQDQDQDRHEREHEDEDEGGDEDTGDGGEDGGGGEGQRPGRAHHRAAAPSPPQELQPAPQAPRTPSVQDAPDRPPTMQPQGPQTQPAPQGPRALFAQDAQEAQAAPAGPAGLDAPAGPDRSDGSGGSGGSDGARGAYGGRVLDFSGRRGGPPR